MAKKLFYSMGEVSEMFDVNPSLIRHWESKFDAIRPKKNKKGNRMFSPEDVEKLKLIYHLVKERGMTLEGANKCLKRGGSAMSRDMEILERLHRVRAMLVEVREELKTGTGEIVTDDVPYEPSVKMGGRKPVQVIEPSVAATADEQAKPKQRKPRRKKDDDNKELFAFYEQSLF